MELYVVVAIRMNSSRFGRGHDELMKDVNNMKDNNGGCDNFHIEFTLKIGQKKEVFEILKEINGKTQAALKARLEYDSEYNDYMFENIEAFPEKGHLIITRVIHRIDTEICEGGLPINHYVGKDSLHNNG